MQAHLRLRVPEEGAHVLAWEEAAREHGYALVAGVDEAGRGPLAGPVVAAAVILRPGDRIAGVTDSKRLTPRRRAVLEPEIRRRAVAVGVGISEVDRIERCNILEATRLAMEEAVAALDPRPDFLLIDALRIASPLPQAALVKGDLRSHSIAAASVVAKVARDRIMERYDRIYPGYGFARHKGYGTAEHRARLRSLGPCPIHRRGFRGVPQDAADAAPGR